MNLPHLTSARTGLARATRGPSGQQDLTNPKLYEAPELDCDIVMKGGLTSGIVYPWGAAELARRYRFRSVGGASAGAMAAVAVAAAEHRRRTTGTGTGFGDLAKVPRELAEGPSDRPRLLTLFQPDPPTQRLFELAMAAISKNRAGILKALVRALPTARRSAAVGLGVSVAALLLECAFLLYGVLSTIEAIALLAATMALSLIVVALAGGIGAFIDLRAIPRIIAENDFGLCRLGPTLTGDSTTNPPLTIWLHQRIQGIAGLPPDQPLTFGALWGIDLNDGICPTHGAMCPYAHEAVETRRQRMRSDTRCRAVNLELMTTNLTSGRPVRLPIPEYGDKTRTLTDLGNLYFDPAEFSKFFPDTVVQHLRRHGRAPQSKTLAKLQIAIERLGRNDLPAPKADALRHFPLGDDLPVVVAARLSLSFPGLIAALPFWQLDYQPDREAPRLVRAWFSDGGITSNFPVHFFDRPLPTRPTFAFDLASFPPGEAPNPLKPAASVSVVREVTETAVENLHEIQSAAGFVIAIKDAMQNWRDDAQAALPGYRERIVHVKLARGEGGLNLAMKAAKINELATRGACAGQALSNLFSGDQPHATQKKLWNDHRFARFRTTMGLLEEMLVSITSSYSAPNDAATIPFATRVVAGETTPPYSFQGKRRREFAEHVILQYTTMIDGWNETLADARRPRPRPAIRIVPPT